MPSGIGIAAAASTRRQRRRRRWCRWGRRNSAGRRDNEDRLVRRPSVVIWWQPSASGRPYEARPLRHRTISGRGARQLRFWRSWLLASIVGERAIRLAAWQRRTAAGHLTSLERAARNAERYHTRSGCEEDRRGAIGSLSLSLTEADSGYSLPGDADDTVSEQHGVSGRHTYGGSGPLAPSRSPTCTGYIRTTGYVLYNYTLVLHVNHLI